MMLISTLCNCMLFNSPKTIGTSASTILANSKNCSITGSSVLGMGSFVPRCRDGSIWKLRLLVSRSNGFS